MAESLAVTVDVLNLEVTRDVLALLGELIRELPSGHPARTRAAELALRATDESPRAKIFNDVSAETDRIFAGEGGAAMPFRSMKSAEWRRLKSYDPAEYARRKRVRDRYRLVMRAAQVSACIEERDRCMRGAE